MFEKEYYKTDNEIINLAMLKFYIDCGVNSYGTYSADVVSQMCWQEYSLLARSKGAVEMDKIYLMNSFLKYMEKYTLKEVFARDKTLMNKNPYFSMLNTCLNDVCKLCFRDIIEVKEHTKYFDLLCMKAQNLKKAGVFHADKSNINPVCRYIEVNIDPVEFKNDVAAMFKASFDVFDAFQDDYRYLLHLQMLSDYLTFNPPPGVDKVDEVILANRKIEEALKKLYYEELNRLLVEDELKLTDSEHLSDYNRLNILSAASCFGSTPDMIFLDEAVVITEKLIGGIKSESFKTAFTDFQKLRGTLGYVANGLTENADTRYYSVVLHALLAEYGCKTAVFQYENDALKESELLDLKEMLQQVNYHITASSIWINAIDESLLKDAGLAADTLREVPDKVDKVWEMLDKLEDITNDLTEKTNKRIEKTVSHGDKSDEPEL